MRNKQLTIEEKIEKIESSENFEDLKAGWFPKSASTSYYFVSYCHKDYKKVFIDILMMQQCDSEIAVWYDRELNAGLDWEKEAKTHIYDFDCLGVIFYISENSVQSPAVFKEMQMAMDAGKPFIPIVVPVENIRSKAGEYLSGAELFDILAPCISENDEKYKLYHEMFGKNILYFKNADSPQDKIERIKKSFTRQPLLELKTGPIDVTDLSKRGVIVVAINNINLMEVKEADYRFFDANNHPMDIFCIGKCAFSNCRQLETIILPKTVTDIEKFAFYNCKKLNNIKIPENSSLEYIGDSAFLNCENLKNITLPNGIKNIGAYAFRGCRNLTSITIPEGVTSIGEWTFASCRNLTSITIPEGVTSIGEWAFFSCRSLTSITIPKGVNSIGEWAFYDCKSLTSITIPKGVKSIGKYAFDDCSSLTNIVFDGTRAEWRKIITLYEQNYCDEFGDEYEIPVSCFGHKHEISVICTDGTLIEKSL